MTERIYVSWPEVSAPGQFVRIDLKRMLSAKSVEFSSLLVGQAGGKWRAYANSCRHRAVPLDLGTDSFMTDDRRHLVCHHHGALYELDDGACVAGPCVGDSLVAFAVETTATGLVIVIA